MQDLCQVARYIRMSSNPTGGFLIKFFPHSRFGDVYFHVLFYYFCVLFVCLFLLIFVCVFCCCIVLYFLYFLNITMKFQDASCPSLAVGVLSSSVEPPSKPLAVSVSFLNVRFDRATFPFSIAQISSFELSSA